MFPHSPHQLSACSLSPFGPGEADALAYGMASMDPWKRLEMSGDQLSRYLRRDDPALTRLAIRMDGALAGAVALRHPWLRGPYLELLTLLPEAQGRGLGRQVMEWAMARAQRHGAANLWACVSEFNYPARAFYGRMGFSEVTVLPGLVIEDENEILLRAELPAL